MTDAPFVQRCLPVRKYAVYVLFVLLIAFALDQMARYTLGVVARPVAQDLEYGDKSCMANTSDLHYSNYSDLFRKTCSNLFHDKKVPSGNRPSLCIQYQFNISCYNQCIIVQGCKWDYDGTGLLYQVIAGPIFVVVFTIGGLLIGLAADRYNRILLYSFSVFVFSISTIGSGLATEYWNLALSRMGLALGESGICPIGSSVIADYFPPSQRALALGIFSWGTYLGYGLSFAAGNAIYDSLGWRWTFFMTGIPGILMAVIIAGTAQHPVRGQLESRKPVIKRKWKTVAVELLRLFFCTPSVLLLCVAGGVRYGAGYVFAYNAELFFQNVMKQTSTQVDKMFSWIPLIGGSISVVVGGLVADKMAKKKRGPRSRLWVVVCSQFLAAPFAAAALYFNPPWCYLSLFPAYVIGEMWISVTLAVGIELVPIHLRTSAVAIYLLIITNIGGNLTAVVSGLKSAFGGTDEAYQWSLLIMFPGMYILGAVLFLCTVFALNTKSYDTTEKESSSSTRSLLDKNCDREETIPHSIIQIQQTDDS